MGKPAYTWDNVRDSETPCSPPTRSRPPEIEKITMPECSGRFALVNPYQPESAISSMRPMSPCKTQDKEFDAMTSTGFSKILDRINPNG